MDSTKILAATATDGDGTSQDIYGDSDADENPFEHPSAHGVKAFASAYSGRSLNSGATISGVEPQHRFSSSGIINGLSSSSMFMGSMQQDSWLQVSHTHGDINLPTIIGHSNPFLNGDFRPGPTAASIDMEVTEVETETEGETENESGEEGDVAYPAYGVTAGGSAMPTAAEWSTSEEKEWVNCIDREVRNAKAGTPNAHAMRYLLRKAGFVPGSLRKDVWRLLILGRVDVGAGGGNANGSGVAQREMLALDAAILSTELDLDNQRVVRVDVERTRPALEQFKRPRVKNMLARLLTHHCKKHGVGYKQGMHEVLAPFVALSDPELPTSEISLCYGAFIKRFLPYAFNKDEEFLSLQICFRLFRILLLYHHPRLCRFLDQYQLQPELYATPWFLTLFASSLDLPRLYEVWDSYLYWGDPALHHFVVLAFVMGNAEVILQEEEANLPETMCRLSVGMRSVEEVRVLVRTAKDLMLNTPKSFRKILRSALYANLSQSQMNLVLNTLQVSSCIPVSAEEVISYILHKNPHRQLDQESDQEDSAVSEANKMSNGNSGNVTSSSSMEPSTLPPREGGDTADRNVRPTSPRRVAERAAMRSLRVHRQYIILDCRPRKEFEACRLAPALHFDPDLLDSPDDLDAKLKEFNPLQGVAHFCLVGAGGDTGADRQRKHVIPSDLSGEAMGILPTSTSKGDHSARRGVSPIRRASSRSERDWDAGGDKDGGFNWMGGFSKALAARVHGVGGGREGEEEVGREEDAQVARFVLMLLQYNFPYISHVRGNMAACLKELSAQALEEMDDEGIPDGDYQETLHGLLIGSDADRVREEMTRCSPEKKSEGLLAGLAKWTMDKGDWKDSSPNEAGAEGVDGIARIPSWIGRDTQSSDRGDVCGKTKRSTEVETAKPQDQHAPQPKTPKRRLFGGVLNRFDKFDAAVVRGNRSGSGDGEEAETGTIEIIESTSPRNGPSASPDARQLLKTANAGTRPPPVAESATAATVEEEEKGEVKAGADAGPSTADARDASRGTVRSSNSILGKKKPTGTWVKPSKVGAPDRLARFLGKVLGVRDDALPDDTLPTNESHGRTCDTVVEIAEEETKEGGEVRTREGSGGQSEPAGTAVEIQEESALQSEESEARSNRNHPAATANGTTSTNDTTTTTTIASSTREATAAADVSSAAETTVTATAVYPSTTAMADALPVAVAVAIPVADGGVVGSDPARPARRPSRNRGARAAGGGSGPGVGAGATAGRRAGEQAAGPVVGEAVLISQWVAREERESGGRVKVFSAQRVLEGKSQKKCRLVVSSKNMVQFDNVRDGDGGARGVISEHRGLRHLARITSRKKHADLIVFHFKSRSSATAAATGSSSRYGASSAATASGSTSSSRRFRVRSTSENDPGQPDVLFYFMREHAECLRMVKENYRKITHGSSGGGSVGGTSNRSTVTPSSGSSSGPSRGREASSAQDSRRPSSQSPVEGHPNRSGRRAAKAAGAVAGATGLVVGATAGVAVGAAAGVAAGAAYLVGHRRGAHSELKARSTSPSRERRRGGGGDVSANVGRRRDSGGWIPIDAPGGWIPIDTQVEARRRADANGAGRGGVGCGRSSAAAGVVRRSNLASTQNGLSRGQNRSSHGQGATGGSSKGRGVANGPTWLGR